MKENTTKSMMSKKELDQVNGGSWCESIWDYQDADHFKQCGVTVTKKPWFDDNMYSYKGKEYNRTDLFKQLKKDGWRKDVTCENIDAWVTTTETEEQWT